MKWSPNILDLWINVFSLVIGIRLFTNQYEMLQYCLFGLKLGIWKWNLGFHVSTDIRNSRYHSLFVRLWLASWVDIEYETFNGFKRGNIKIGNYRKGFTARKTEKEDNQ